MPYFVKIEVSENTVFIRHIGQVSLENLCDQIEGITRHENFSSGLNFLYDHREEIPPDHVTRQNDVPNYVNSSNQTRLKTLFAKFKNNKMACVIDEQFVDKFASLAELMDEVETIENGIFFETQSAQKWLGISSEYNVEQTLENLIFAYDD